MFPQPSILVVLGSTRDGRQGEKVAKLTAKHLKAAGLEPTIIGRVRRM